MLKLAKLCTERKNKNILITWDKRKIKFKAKTKKKIAILNYFYIKNKFQLKTDVEII